MQRGRGPYVWDADGNKYLDFIAGIAVNNLGHCPASIVGALRQQSGKLIHCSNLYYIAEQAELAELLVKKSGLHQAFFCNSGAEAIEAALKFSRYWGWTQNTTPKKFRVVSAKKSFHGRTMMALTATGQKKYQQGFFPLVPGFRKVPYNDIPALKKSLDNSVVAVLLEPIQGEGGVHFPHPDYLREVAVLCKQKDILLIFDEVQTGMGRTGKLFAFEHFGVRPDILCLAKGLGSGFPIGACLVGKKVASVIKPGLHASTFGGSALGSRVAFATCKKISAGKFLAHVQAMGKFLATELMALKKAGQPLAEIQALGLMGRFKLSRPLGSKLVLECQKNGLLINAIENQIIRLMPPLIVQKYHIRQAIKILNKSINNTYASN